MSLSRHSFVNLVFNRKRKERKVLKKVSGGCNRQVATVSESCNRRVTTVSCCDWSQQTSCNYEICRDVILILDLFNNSVFLGQFTEVRLASPPPGGLTTMTAINQPEKKPARRISVQCFGFFVDFIGFFLFCFPVHFLFGCIWYIIISSVCMESIFTIEQ